MMTMTDDRQSDPAEEFAANRSTLVGVAYRMLGQVADAEDVVQDAWLRWADVAHDEIRDPKAFLVRITAGSRSTGCAE
jgi:RNA polymerase sigma-70 factor, ECF subfamily